MIHSGLLSIFCLAVALIRFPIISPVVSPMYSGRKVGILYRRQASSRSTIYIFLIIDLLSFAGISSENIPANAPPKRGPKLTAEGLAQILPEQVPPTAQDRIVPEGQGQVLQSGEHWCLHVRWVCLLTPVR